MAFTTLPDSIIQVGKSLTRTLFKTYIKDNLDDLDSRLTSVEGSAGKIVVIDDLVIGANNLSNASTITGLIIYRVPAAFSLIDAKISIFTKGSLTGTLQMDIKKSTSLDFSGASTVFTTLPSIAYSGASDYDESTNAVFDNTAKDVIEGNYLRFDITSLPSGDSFNKFHVYLIGEAS